ncbi:hypothetical protein GA0070616_4605 [Micromonospora nigra]|uniref:Uncharacterized protein n=1 Tax=Micromonospora nigra TaxID=145857 RepID=A0A1C6STM1_9ACTN|nr:hypothetical protein [Micromonospora nigra]SCL32984.1 hypothetical protein GA0070616_4605 [Micromonospora nigra]
MTSAQTIARQLADFDRRLSAVERTAQAPRTSIEGGALTINNADGFPVVVLGDQGDGTAGLTAYNGATVAAGPGALIVANDLDLPEGSITETDIADDSISTPKLRANSVTADTLAAGAVTADAISAGAIDGQTITGATLVGGEVIMEGADGSRVRLYEDPVDGAVVSMLPGDAPAGMTPAALATWRAPDGSDVGTVLRGPKVDNGVGTPETAAEIILTGRSFNGTIDMNADYVTVTPYFGLTVAGPSGLYVEAGATIDEDLTVEGDAAVTGTLTADGPALFAEGRLASAQYHAASTSARSLTSTTYNDLTGAAVTVTTLRPGAMYLALWSADCELTATGSATATVRLDAAGTVLPQLALANFANVTTGARMSAAQFAIGTLGAAGEHVMKLQASRAVGTGTVRVNATHTTLTVIVFE